MRRPRLLLTLFGAFHARLDPGSALVIPSRKGQALLAYLALAGGRTHSRDALATLLWPDSPAEQARGSLRYVLAVTRRALGPTARPCLITDAENVAIDRDRVEVDVTTFERLAAQGDLPALERAARLYAGELLAGLRFSEPQFEEWLRSERERLRECALGVLARVLTAQNEAGNTDAAIQAALRLLSLDPLQEPVHRTLMRLYARQGRRGVALKQYRLCVDALERELGAEPERETKALYHELLSAPREAPRSRPVRSATAAAPELPAMETPLFGRQADLARLRRRLHDAVGGAGHVVTVVGEAGIGKTRLVTTFAADAVAESCRVVFGHCHESDAVLAFAPWVDACRRALAVDDDALRSLHPSRRAELARLLPEAGLPGLPAPSDSLLSLFESVAELFEQMAARQPLVLVLEDVHWADDMSLRLLAFVGRRLPDRPALLIVTSRDEDLADAALAQRTLEELSHAPRSMTVRLAPLSRADIARIVRALTRVGSEAASLEDGVWAISEGNPLVAVEAMLALAGHGENGGARESPSDLALPERVRALIGRRLDRLGASAQSVAAVAAVIGRRFTFALLHAASGLAEPDAAAAVEEMVRRRVLRTIGNELEFTHDRVRDVAYRRLLPARRRLLHAAAVDALEAVAETATREGPGEQIEQLAYHAVRGELTAKAVRYLRQVADRAAARSALQNARAALEQALELLGTLPQNTSTWEEGFDIRLALRPVLVQLGELRSALSLLREAEDIGERLKDDRRRAQVSAFLTNIHARLDEPAAAIDAGSRALSIAGRLGDSRLGILATTYLAQAHYCRGEYERVIELATRNLAALPPEWVHEFLGGSQPPSVNDRFRLLVSLAHLGRFSEAAGHAARTIALAEATDHAYTIGVAYYAVGTLHLVKGEWDCARAVIDRQIAVLRAGNAVGELPTALAHSARALAYLGDASAALETCQEAERLLDDRAAMGRAGAGWIYYSLGRAHFVLGRLDEARRLACRAVDSASGRTDFLPDALQLLGDVVTHPDELDTKRGSTCYTDALALATERGMRPLVAHCHLGLGRLHRETGDGARAGEHLATATALYREMDMRFWLEKAEALAEH